MKREFPLMSLLLIPIGIALNFVIGSLATWLKLPIFLDSVGTVLAAVLGGPIVGAVTGFLGVLSISAFAPSAVVWSLQAGVIGFITGLLASYGWFKGVAKVAVSTTIIIGLSVLGSTVISYLVYGGFDGYGIGLIRAVLVESGVSLPVAIIVTSAVAELIDKTISVVVPMLVIGFMSDRALSKFVNGTKLRNLSMSDSESAAQPDGPQPSAYGSYGDEQ